MGNLENKLGKVVKRDHLRSNIDPDLKEVFWGLMIYAAVLTTIVGFAYICDLQRKNISPEEKKEISQLSEMAQVYHISSKSLFAYPWGPGY